MTLLNPPGNVSDLIAAAKEAAEHINRQREAMRQVSAEIAATPKLQPEKDVTR